MKCGRGSVTLAGVPHQFEIDREAGEGHKYHGCRRNAVSTVTSAGYQFRNALQAVLAQVDLTDLGIGRAPKAFGLKVDRPYSGWVSEVDPHVERLEYQRGPGSSPSSCASRESTAPLGSDEGGITCGHRGLVGSAVQRKFEVKGFSDLIGRTSSELDLKSQSAPRSTRTNIPVAGPSGSLMRWKTASAMSSTCRNSRRGDSVPQFWTRSTPCCTTSSFRL